MITVRSFSQGYTIVETMIFLAVSGGLLAGALVLVGGQQARTEFYQSVREVNAQIQDILNDVATGYYSRPSDLTCSFNGSPVAGGSAQGTNQECIFIGRAMGFGTNTDKAQVTIFNVAGNRLTGAAPTSPIVTNLTEANPRTILSPETSIMPSGLTVGDMYYRDNAGIETDVGAFGFFSTLSQTYSGNLAGGQNTQLIVYTVGTNWGTQGVGDIRNAINSTTNTSPVNKTGYITICLLSGGSDQRAHITIGGQGKLTTRVEIFNKRVCP